MQQQDAKRAIDAIVFELEAWANWMKGHNPRLGYPSRAIGLEGWGGSNTFDELCEAADRDRCLVVDGTIRDLSPAQRCAIEHRYLGSVIRFPRQNYAELLAMAHVQVSIGLRKKGIDIPELVV